MEFLLPEFDDGVIMSPGNHTEGLFMSLHLVQATLTYALKFFCVLVVLILALDPSSSIDAVAHLASALATITKRM